MANQVKFVLPTSPIYIGTYLKVPVEIAKGSGYTIDNLEFMVKDGPKGGKISLSRDSDYNTQKPDIMLLAGFKPGKYTLQAVRQGSTTIVAQSQFETTLKRLEKKMGPSIWFEGAVKGNKEQQPWGTAKNSPQNFNMLPATGLKRMAIILVDTASERFTTDPAQLNAMRKLWKDAAQDGLSAGGKLFSTAHYYREVSYGNLDVEADVFGPYHFAESWDQIFGPGAAFDFMQSTITIADGDVNYNNYETIVGVMKSFTTALPDRLFVWPNANHVGISGPYKTSEGDKSFGIIAMPDDWGTALEISATLSHEFGHNLGLSDLYDNARKDGRVIGDWDLMAFQNNFPHLSLAERLMLGWVQPSWITPFNFALATTAVDQIVKLSPIEKGAPPAGCKAGIEVRMANGWNYYFEYRKSQAAHVGDQHLPTDDRVLGTDVISQPFFSPIARPPILLLNKDSDGDGPVLGNGQNYRDAQLPIEMRVDVNAINSLTADVRVRYGTTGKPDPSIRDWSPPPWQSPDIEIRNERNRVDPVWFNVPWDGNDNTVVAKVKNSGDMDAPNVVVNFFLLDANVGGAPPTFIGSDTKTVPAGQTVDFTTNWNVPREGHYCVTVRIPIYATPATPAIPMTVEMTELNNVAQSNYDRFISRTSSAPSRETTYVCVKNPYSKAAYIVIAASQNDGNNIVANRPYFRTYIENTWLFLNAGETKRIKVMFEGTGSIPLNIDKRILNDVQIVGYIYDPLEKTMDRVNRMSGYQAQIEQGRAVQFISFASHSLKVSGTLETVDNHQPVTKGKVIITVQLSNSPKDQYVTVPLNSNGQFSAYVPEKWKSVIAYYVPAIGFGDARSKQLFK